MQHYRTFWEIMENRTWEFIDKPGVSDYTLPDPRLLNIEELKELFLKVSKEFTDQLPCSKEPHEVRELEILHNYIKEVTLEIELRDKLALTSL